jgi:hypothetical protein
MNTDCAACRSGQCRACVGYRGPLQTYLCGCYARTPASDAERHPLTYEGQQAAERRTESLERAFWRLVGTGLDAGAIGKHPDYQAAWAREHPVGHGCLTCVTGRAFSVEA